MREPTQKRRKCKLVGKAHIGSGGTGQAAFAAPRSPARPPARIDPSHWSGAVCSSHTSERGIERACSDRQMARRWVDAAGRRARGLAQPPHTLIKNKASCESSPVRAWRRKHFNVPPPSAPLLPAAIDFRDAFRERPAAAQKSCLLAIRKKCYAKVRCLLITWWGFVFDCLLFKARMVGQ